MEQKEIMNYIVNGGFCGINCKCRDSSSNERNKVIIKNVKVRYVGKGSNQMNSYKPLLTLIFTMRISELHEI